MNRRQLAVGIDIGGTKIAGGLVDVITGTIVTRQIVPTHPQRGADRVFADIDVVTSVLTAAANQDHLPIGIGLPELIAPNGAIRSSHIIDWSGFEISAGTLVEADVRTAAIAESRFGAGRGAASFLYVSIGTGISSTFVKSGIPLVGHRGNALVVASSPRNGIIPEEIAGGPGLVRQYREATNAEIERAEDVVSRIDDPIALDIVDRSTALIAENIALAIDILDPERIVLGGGLGSAPGLYVDLLIPHIRSRIWAPDTRELPIVQAQLGGDAGIVGAAIAAWVAAPTTSLEELVR